MCQRGALSWNKNGLILDRSENRGWLLPAFRARGGINLFFQVTPGKSLFFQVIPAFSSVTSSTFVGFPSSGLCVVPLSVCVLFISSLIIEFLIQVVDLTPPRARPAVNPRIWDRSVEFLCPLQEFFCVVFFPPFPRGESQQVLRGQSLPWVPAPKFPKFPNLRRFQPRGSAEGTAQTSRTR